MQIDTSKLKNILNLNDEEFKKKISEAAKVGGVDDDKVSKMLKDVNSVKKTLGSLSEQDIMNAINSIDSSKLESLVKNIKNNQT
jgi:hypothetical protein